MAAAVEMEAADRDGKRTETMDVDHEIMTFCVDGCWCWTGERLRREDRR